MKFQGLNEILIIIVTSATTYIFSNIKNKNQRKKINFESLNSSFQEIIESQNKLMLQNVSLINQLITKQSEIIELKEKIDNLQKRLNKYINEKF